MRIRKQGGGSTDWQWMALMYRHFNRLCTFEERIDAPYCDWSETCELSEREFKEEERKADQRQGPEVRN